MSLHWWPLIVSCASTQLVGKAIRCSLGLEKETIGKISMAMSAIHWSSSGGLEDTLLQPRTLTPCSG